MKLVKEYINEKFTEDSDPIQDLGIGLRHKIIEWLNKMHIEEYIINDDLSIDVNETINFNRLLCRFNALPDYIQFNRINRSFFISWMGLISLKGCPKFISGTFGCSNNKLTSLEYFPEYVGKNVYLHSNSKKFIKEDIKKVCNVKGEIGV